MSIVQKKSRDRDTPASAPDQRFGWVTEGLARGPDATCDMDLYAEESIAVVPTKGSLVHGWVLIIPRRPVLSIAHLSDGEREDVVEILASVTHQISALARYVFYFEHGAATIFSVTGCGVDQAHVHVAPLDFNLIETVHQYDAQGAWVEVDAKDPWATLNRARDYYLISDFESAYVKYPLVKRSQFFRRAIAHGLGRPNEWDYRAHPNYENTRKTIVHFRRGAPINRAA